MIQVKCRKSADHLVTSPADDAATSGAGDSAADTSDEPRALSTELPAAPPCDNEEEDDSSQDDGVTSDVLRPLRLELTPESQLDSTQPVCVDLLDCSAPVTDVLHWLTSATWYMHSVSL